MDEFWSIIIINKIGYKSVHFAIRPNNDHSLSLNQIKPVLSDGWVGGGAFYAQIPIESYGEFNENTQIKKRHHDQRRIGEAGKLYEVNNGLLNDIKRCVHIVKMKL